MYVPPRNDIDYSRRRLNAILGSHRLVFNPYTVSDRRLVEIVSAAGWGGEQDLTQAVVMRFTRLRKTGDVREFDGIFVTVGPDDRETFLSYGMFVNGITANDTLRLERSILGSRRLCNREDVRKLEGKRVFVSRTVRGVDIQGRGRVAYRMHRLTGREERDAVIIREEMCAAKIEMLERLLAYPDCPDYLSCSKNLFDYEPRVRKAIEIIRRYHLTPVPDN